MDGRHYLKLGKSMRYRPSAPFAARISNCLLVVGSTMSYCAVSAYLCDWGLLGNGSRDAPLCAEHPQEVGHDQHLCPAHAAQQREAT